MGQVPGALVLERPSSSKRILRIAGAIAFLVALVIVISIAVHAWGLNQSDQSKYVTVDGNTLVGVTCLQ